MQTASLNTLRKSGTITDPVLRQKLMKLYSKKQQRALYRCAQGADLKAGKTPGPGGSLGNFMGLRS
ncbi:MAG: hypothetical protein CM15mP49_33190 [Actinomycetota bacterium]|nr:MAG: hypothetical protein CM15mP49_33190 [Actinomycetota bacterium]